MNCLRCLIVSGFKLVCFPGVWFAGCGFVVLVVGCWGRLCYAVVGCLLLICGFVTCVLFVVYW